MKRLYVSAFGPSDVFQVWNISRSMRGIAAGVLVKPFDMSAGKVGYNVYIMIDQRSFDRMLEVNGREG